MAMKIETVARIKHGSLTAVNSGSIVGPQPAAAIFQHFVMMSELILLLQAVRTGSPGMPVHGIDQGAHSILVYAKRAALRLNVALAGTRQISR